MNDYERREWDRKMAEREAERGQLKPEFDSLISFMGLHDYGLGVPAFRRAEDAIRVLRRWRYLHNNARVEQYEEPILTIRIAADQFAVEIEDHARDAGLDPATVRAITAGLRCPRRPYCTGCPDCQTITSPLRANRTLKTLWR